MRNYFLPLFFLLNSCSWFGPATSSPNHPKIVIVRNAIEKYNNHDLDTYIAFFTTNMNYLHTNGLGNTRIASGAEDFKNFNRKYFAQKIGKIKILEHFYSDPWVFVHQVNEMGPALVESTTGYRIENDKIADVLVIGERNMK